MIEVEWRLAEQGKARFAPFLARALHYAPPWLRSLVVRENTADDASLLNTSVMEEYRVSVIRVSDAWYAESEPEQLIAAIHEVLHSHVEGLAVVFRDLLQAVEPDEKAALRKWGEEQWRRAEEACISDLSRAIAARETLIP